MGDVSCTEMSEVFNRCVDYESSFSGSYTCGDVATFALDYACNGTSATASGIFDYLVEIYEEIGVCKELTKMMGNCFIEWGTGARGVSRRTPRSCRARRKTSAAR